MCDVRDGSDLLETVLHHLRHGRDVLVEQDRQVGLLVLIRKRISGNGKREKCFYVFPSVTWFSLVSIQLVT